MADWNVEFSDETLNNLDMFFGDGGDVCTEEKQEPMLCNSVEANMLGYVDVLLVQPPEQNAAGVQGDADAAVDEVLLDDFLIQDENEPASENNSSDCEVMVKLEQGHPSQPSTPPEDRSAVPSSISSPIPQSPEETLVTEKRKRTEEDEDSDRGQSPSFSELRIRPEDDPQGLFQRDPSTLTSEEMKLLKKQKRLIKNRESAQLSRCRKKQHLDNLQVQMAALEKERVVMKARLQELTQENTMLKQKLAASEAKEPTTGAESKPTSTESAQSSLPRVSVALAAVFMVGMMFTGIDLRGERLPAPYDHSRHSIASYPASDASLQGPVGRGGRVLLSASEDFTQNEWQGMPDKKQLLIVTLLDHIVSGQKVSSPTLFQRLCRRLQDMGVLDGCSFMDSMDKVRDQYLSDFQALHEEFAKDEDEVTVDARFSFDSMALAKHTPDWHNSQTVSTPVKDLPVPLPGLPMGKKALWGFLDGAALRSKFNVLCPAAQLLISDRPANQGKSLGTRLERKEKTPFVNSTADEGNDAEPETDISSKDHGLSIVLPRHIIQTREFMGERSGYDDASLVEVRCEAFDVRAVSPGTRGLVSQ